jgi:Flp pilus assembly protein TadB
MHLGRHADGNDKDGRPPSLQFSLKTLLGVAIGCALVFGLLNWLGVSPRTGFVVLVVLAASMMAALGLWLVIAYGVTEDDDDC